MVGGGQYGPERVPQDRRGDAGLFSVVNNPPEGLGGLVRRALDSVVERIKRFFV